MSNLFKRKRASVVENSTAQESIVVPSWLGLVLCLLLMIFLVLIIFTWKPWKPVTNTESLTASADLVTQSNKEMNQDYQFYDLLPKQQVTPIPAQAIPKNTDNDNKKEVIIDDGSKTSAEQQKYILQIKSFSDPDQADSKRAEIILSGINANVVVSNDGKQIWYRVVSEPYSSIHAAKSAQQTLKNSGIDSIVTKLD